MPKDLAAELADFAERVYRGADREQLDEIGLCFMAGAFVALNLMGGPGPLTWGRWHRLHDEARGYHEARRDRLRAEGQL